MDDGGPKAGGTPVSDDEPGYGIGAVARRLGVPAPTLRTWNLRYGIGPSRRSPGGHRRYDASDLRALEEMNRLIHAGLPPADAAMLALRLRAPAASADAGAVTPAAPLDTEAGAEAVRGGLRPEAASAADAEVARLAAASGDGLLSPAMVARAAMALDSRTVGDAVRAALNRHGVIWTWEQLVIPVFATIVRKQRETGFGVDIEHLFSDRVLAGLNEVARRSFEPLHPRPALLACAEDEQHSLPVRALAAALAERRVETRVLGARTPYSALADAMRRLGPAVVFVWSSQTMTGDPAPLAGLPKLRPASRVVVGGPGWWDALPPGVPRVSSLPDAISEVMSALR
ncbi:MerR family transcriptional regulator [Planotetraspora sp. A-T 1434]|uniref:MerR family transcriptional regulator n=1 Tax=Planotetraspora sp. A-T 1434 TaxID=2979219 RepID=UPI0021C2213A|nr:MerR family transcriptional regulator [Planotetraspora sp. A-T 1434]MCT9934343.1 MerR family transcriptional regulator [Planotetraspora sp. A-T 1434]